MPAGGKAEWGLLLKGAGQLSTIQIRDYQDHIPFLGQIILDLPSLHNRHVESGGPSSPASASVLAQIEVQVEGCNGCVST